MTERMNQSNCPLGSEAFCCWARRVFGQSSVAARGVTEFAARHPELDAQLGYELQAYGVACGEAALTACRPIPAKLVHDLISTLRDEARAETEGAARGLAKAAEYVEAILDAGETLARERMEGGN